MANFNKQFILLNFFFTVTVNVVATETGLEDGSLEQEELYFHDGNINTPENEATPHPHQPEGNGTDGRNFIFHF
uniref:Uncharacterized protein n=1 Tax=Panagrolaimus sp. JU765 TaxID=591449 RepID=A0AC34RL93_9BILA